MKSLPSLKIVIEHLGGAGVWALRETERPAPPYTRFRQMLKLADYPNTYIKIHGMGEICPPPFPYQEIPPIVDLAYDAFGPQRMMVGERLPAGKSAGGVYQRSQVSHGPHAVLQPGEPGVDLWKNGSVFMELSLRIPPAAAGLISTNHLQHGGAEGEHNTYHSQHRRVHQVVGRAQSPYGGVGKESSVGSRIFGFAQRWWSTFSRTVRVVIT